MTTDLNTFLTALYVKIDDWLERVPRAGRPPRLSDPELLTLAVAQALLGVRSQARWLRFVPRHLPGAFPYLPGQSGYNKRLRAALPLLKRAIRALAADTDLWSDSAWVVDVSAELDRFLAERGVRLLRPSYCNHTPRPGEHLLKPIRQLIEPVNDTLKGQLDLELHRGRSIEGVAVRVAQRLLALTTAIWHNRATGQPVTRSLIAYEH